VNNYRPHLLPLSRPAPTPTPDRLNPIIANHWVKRFPVDYYVAARPLAQTTNQTLSMIGALGRRRPPPSRPRRHLPSPCFPPSAPS
jgi:hypothetical protein